MAMHGCHGRARVPSKAKGGHMKSKRTRQEVLDEIAGIESMQRGTLSAIRRPSGSVYHNLQFWDDGKNRCEYVPQERLGKVQEAVANDEHFCDLTAEYAEVVEHQTRQVQGTGKGDKKKRTAK